MRTVFMTSESLEALVEERRRSGVGRLDECWEGTWHLTDPTGTHQRIAFTVCRILAEIIQDTGLGTAWISINLTDRETGWKKNHRCPDGAVILKDNPGRWIEGDVAFLGGPDLVLEVLSRDDDTYQKLPFYARLGCRELLVVDPETFATELWQLGAGELTRIEGPLASSVTGLVFLPESGRLDVSHPASGRTWTVG